MTAELLSTDLDTGLERDPEYRPAIAALHRLVLQSGVQLADLMACLNAQLPKAAPPHIKVLAVEAVARQLDRDWSDDTASFIDVTIASARLQNLAQALAAEAAELNTTLDAPFAAILLPHGEQHSLMPHLTGALFQAFGWQFQVLVHDHGAQPDFADAVARADAICVGWSNIRLKREVGDLMDDIRRCQGAKNPPLMAGGASTLDCIDFLIETGIDCVCDSAYSAVRIADSFRILGKGKAAASSAAIHPDHKTIRTVWRTP